MATCNEDHEYQGWKNYETWVTKLWLDNEQAYYNDYMEWAKQVDATVEAKNK